MPLLLAIADAPEHEVRAELDAPPGRGVPLRDPALSGPRVHVQARAHARGGVPGAAPRPAARPARPHHRGHRAALARARRRAGRAAGPPRPARGAVGEGGRLSPPGGAPGHGAGRQPRGHRPPGAGARGPPPSPRDPGDDRADHRHPHRPPERAPPARRSGAHGGAPPRGGGARQDARRPAPARADRHLHGDPVPGHWRLRRGRQIRAGGPEHRANPRRSLDRGGRHVLSGP